MRIPQLTTSEQLPLNFEAGARRALPDRLRPMLPIEIDAPYARVGKAEVLQIKALAWPN
ncbi:MAG: hypothetical protein ABI797_07645 [Chloroflexota bacterium]